MNLLNKHQKKIDKIKEFKDAYINYLFLNRIGCNSDQEENDLFLLREKLSSLVGEVSYYVENSGVASYVHYSPPTIVGGMAGNVDLLANLFNLDELEIPTQLVIDALNRAIGNLEYRQKQFKKELINPVCWVREFIRIPFHLLRFSGFNANHIEFSWFGKTYKFLATVIMFLAALLTVLNLLGFNTRLSFLDNGASSNVSN